MSRPLVVLAGLAMFVGASSVWAAAGGRIVFSGAVVEPTCAMAEAGPVAHEAVSPAAQHLACGRSYTRQVIDLATASRGHDRLLDYFISYAPRDADGAAAAKLVVHTYD